jgi:ABC-type multidrug transport system fused ATPase/permease subunit
MLSSGLRLRAEESPSGCWDNERMIDDWRKLLSFFPARKRYRILALLISTTVSGLLAAAGIASIMPFIAVVTDPTLVVENEYLSWAYEFFAFNSLNQFLIFLGFGAMLVLLASNLLVGINAWLTFRVCHLGEYDLARRLLRKYLASPYQQMLQRNSTELLKMLVREIDRVVIGTLMAGISVFSDAVTTVFIVALLLWIHPWVTIVTLIVLAAAYGVIYRLVIPRVTRLGSEFAPLNTEIYKSAHEALGAVREIKVLGCEEHFVDRFSRPLLRSSRNAIAYNTLNIIPAQSLELIAFGGLFAAAIFMISHAGAATRVLPMLALFAFAAYRLVPALKELFDGVAEIRYNMAALDPLWRDYADSHTGQTAPAADFIELRSALQLDNVFFRYPGSREEVLSGVELTISAGKWVCLAGPTGAGKSTLVDVLLGLLPPSRGRVMVDETPVTPDNLRAWQRNIGYVPQVASLLDDTVMNNIAFGVESDDIDLNRLEQAARIAEIHDFIVTELPEGYGSLVGERGASLSGGQRQRIGIARALYRDPPVLVLDEATNELDLVTEARILASLRSLENKTILFVSHKPSVSISCDEIVVLESGRIVAQGSFADLTAPGSRYRALLLEPSQVASA